MSTMKSARQSPVHVIKEEKVKRFVIYVMSPFFTAR